MEFLDKFKKKKGSVNKEDVMTVEKKDRRVLSHVPDSTNKRTNTERRGNSSDNKNNDYEAFLKESKSGVRYVTGFPVHMRSFTVTVDDDMTVIDPSLTLGARVTLKGDLAQKFIRQG